MNEINRTLYIPLYGKAQVSRRGIILRDKKAEEIWRAERFALKGKAGSKWLTFFMAMRARVFDEWTAVLLYENPDALVLHIGCGLDSRALRVGTAAQWYDVDFPDVIAERRRYYAETDSYRMLGADASKPAAWLEKLPAADDSVVILEGISMYLKNEEVRALFLALQGKFPTVHILMDAYTAFSAKASKYKNPINDVGVTEVYGIDTPESMLVNSRMRFVREGDMTPDSLVNELDGFERFFFSRMFAGKFSRKIYRLFEYEIKM